MRINLRKQCQRNSHKVWKITIDSTKMLEELIKNNVESLKANISSATQSEPMIVAVSKKKSVDHILAALNQGINNFGKTMPLSLQKKRNLLMPMLFGTLLAQFRAIKQRQ